MKTIIAGSRTITKYSVLLKAIENSPFKITSVVSGTAFGVDRLGERYAKENNLPLYRFPANWDLYGKSAGYIRNKEMADNAEALLALWDSKSKGTLHMIRLAKDRGLTVYVPTYDTIQEWSIDG